MSTEGTGLLTLLAARLADVKPTFNKTKTRLDVGPLRISYQVHGWTGRGQVTIESGRILRSRGSSRRYSNLDLSHLELAVRRLLAERAERNAVAEERTRVIEARIAREQDHASRVKFLVDTLNERDQRNRVFGWDVDEADTPTGPEYRYGLKLQTLTREEALAILSFMATPTIANISESHEPGCDLFVGKGWCSCSPYKEG